MRKVISKFSIVLIALLSVLSIFSLDSNSVKAAATSGDYAIKPAGTSNDNVNIDNGTYVVKGDPGQTVTLELTVLNKASDTRRFKYYVNTAYTNNQGVVSYDRTGVTDSALKVKTANAVKPNKAVFKIPGKTSATLSVKLTIPKTKFNGYIMGGFYVTPYKEKAKGTVSQNGTLIKNRFGYAMPIQITQTGAKNVDPKYAIRTVKPVTVQSGKNHPGVAANIHNSTNSYAGDLSSSATVTKKGDKKFKITENKSNQELAPTSNYNYSISWGNKRLEAGNYHLKLVYKTQGGLRSWVLNKDFTITNSDAAKYNKLAGIKPNYLWLYILLAILLLAIILGLGVYLGKRNNNNNNGNNGNNNGGNASAPKRRRR